MLDFEVMPWRFVSTYCRLFTHKSGLYLNQVLTYISKCQKVIVQLAVHKKIHRNVFFLLSQVCK